MGQRPEGCVLIDTAVESNTHLDGDLGLENGVVLAIVMRGKVLNAGKNRLRFRQCAGMTTPGGLQAAA